MDTDSLYKNRIGLRLATILMDSFEAGKIDKGDLSYLSSYILGEMDEAKNSSEVFNFVLKLAEEWPIFEEVIKDPGVKMPEEQHVDTNVQNAKIDSGFSD